MFKCQRYYQSKQSPQRITDQGVTVCIWVRFKESTCDFLGHKQLQKSSWPHGIYMKWMWEISDPGVETKKLGCDKWSALVWNVSGLWNWRKDRRIVPGVGYEMHLFAVRDSSHFRDISIPWPTLMQGVLTNKAHNLRLASFFILLLTVSLLVKLPIHVAVSSDKPVKSEILESKVLKI